MQQLNKIWIILLLNAVVVISNAQTKQEIYNDPNIVWAAIINIDIIPDATADQDWKPYKISGLSNQGFTQKSKNLLSAKVASLAEQVVGEAETLPFYETANLKSQIPYPALELTNAMEEPENYGSRTTPYPLESFCVFQLKGTLYYHKKELNFYFVPQAVAVASPTYGDGDNRIYSYERLGWLPIIVNTGPKQLAVKKAGWAKRIYRDIPLEKVRVFKQEWMLSEVFNHFMTSVREQASTILLWGTKKQSEKKLTVEEIKFIGTEEIETMDMETLEDAVVHQPIADDKFVGINLTFDWAWNTKKQILEMELKQFSPMAYQTALYCQDCEDNQYLEHFFIKKYERSNRKK